MIKRPGGCGGDAGLPAKTPNNHKQPEALKKNPPPEKPFLIKLSLNRWSKKFKRIENFIICRCQTVEAVFCPEKGIPGCDSCLQHAGENNRLCVLRTIC